FSASPFLHALLRFPFGGSLAPPGQEALGTPREFLVLSRNGRASGNPSPGVVFSLPVCGLVERSTALIPRRPWRPVRARSLSAVLGQRRAARAPAFAPSFTCQSVANHLLARSRSADFRDAVSAFAVGGDREPAIPPEAPLHGTHTFFPVPGQSLFGQPSIGIKRSE